MSQITGQRKGLFLLILFLALLSCRDIGEQNQLAEQETVPTSSMPVPTDQNAVGLGTISPTPIHQGQAITGTVTYTSQSTTPIFFLIRDEAGDESEIWKTNADGTVYNQLFAFSTSYPITALPPQELSILRRHYCSGDNQDNCPTEIHFGPEYLRLSPNKEMLAWAEGAIWCPSTSCYGFRRIISWNMLSRDRKVIFEVPLHIDEVTVQGFADFSWSPSGDQVGFVLSSRQAGWSFLHVVNIDTEQDRVLGEGRNPLAWSPGSQQIAVAIPGSQGWGVSLINLEGTVLQRFGGSWGAVMAIDWSPDTSKLAITAQGTSDAYRNELFIVDLNTGKITEIDPVPGGAVSYTEPRWAPDGRLLGVIATTETQQKELIIFDWQEEVISSSLSLGYPFDKWSWSDDGSAILMRVGGDITVTPYVPQGIGIFYWREHRFELLSLPDDMKEGLEKRNIYLIDLTW